MSTTAHAAAPCEWQGADPDTAHHRIRGQAGAAAPLPTPRTTTHTHAAR